MFGTPRPSGACILHKVLADVEIICVTWAGLRKRLEAEKNVTISTLDFIADSTFNTVLLASTNIDLCQGGTTGLSLDCL